MLIYKPTCGKYNNNDDKDDNDDDNNYESTNTSCEYMCIYNMLP